MQLKIFNLIYGPFLLPINRSTGGELFKAGIEGKYRHILVMLLGLVVSISIIVLPNNISAVIRALNTDEDNRTGQDVPHFQVGENPHKILLTHQMI